MTVMVPLNGGAVKQALPVVFTVYVKGEPVVVLGDPWIVTVLPTTPKVIPAGKPVIVTPVAPPSRVYRIGATGVLIQTVWVLSEPAFSVST